MLNINPEGSASFTALLPLTIPSLRIILKGLHCSLDDVILDALAQIHKKGTIAGYPNYEVLTVLGMGLGIEESIPVYHVELYVGIPEVCP